MTKRLTVYEVTSRFFYDGKVTTKITNVFKASTLPDKVCTMLDSHDEYLDYFTNQKDAEEYISK